MWSVHLLNNQWSKAAAPWKLSRIYIVLILCLWNPRWEFNACMRCTGFEMAQRKGWTEHLFFAQQWGRHGDLFFFLNKIRHIYFIVFSGKFSGTPSLPSIQMTFLLGYTLTVSSPHFSWNNLFHCVISLQQSRCSVSPESIQYKNSSF